MFFWLLVFEDAQQSSSSTRWYKIFYFFELNLNWNNMSTTGSLSETLPAQLLSRESSSNWNHATVDKTRRSSRWHRHSQPGAGQLQSWALDPLYVQSQWLDPSNETGRASELQELTLLEKPVSRSSSLVCLSFFVFVSPLLRWRRQVGRRRMTEAQMKFVTPPVVT